MAAQASGNDNEVATPVPTSLDAIMPSGRARSEYQCSSFPSFTSLAYSFWYRRNQPVAGKVVQVWSGNDEQSFLTGSTDGVFTGICSEWPPSQAATSSAKNC